MLINSKAPCSLPVHSLPTTVREAPERRAWIFWFSDITAILVNPLGPVSPGIHIFKVDDRTKLAHEIEVNLRRLHEEKLL